MNRIKFDINITPQSTEKIYRYELLIGNRIIYNGKIFTLSNQSKILLDCTDILNNFEYKNLGMLNQVWNGTEYTQPITQITLLNDSSIEQHYNKVSFKLYNDNNNLIAQQSKNVYFQTITFENEQQQKLINNKYYYFGDKIPKMPLTDKLRYCQLVYSANTTNTTWNNINLGSEKGSRIYNISIPTIDLYDGKEKILEVDKECLAPYYLCWITTNKGFQCQPFYYTNYSETFTRNEKLSTDEVATLANVSLRGNWEIRTNLLKSDNEFKFYTDIYKSASLLLYITELDKAVFVNVVDTTVDFKKYKQQNKPQYFQVKLQSADIQLNLY